MELDTATVLAIGGVIYGAASDLIGMNKKLKSNSIVEIVMFMLGRIFKK